MLAFITGNVVSAKEGSIVLENNGIGYELLVSNNTLSSLGSVGNKIQLFSYLQAKEDGICLFGFYSQEEKSMFLKLISVSGIGPKVALSILSGTTLSSLAVAIITEDVKTLSKIKGIGKKTAERLVLELKENISGDDAGEEMPVSTGLNKDNDDAVNALIALGITRSDAYKAVMASCADANSIEELIALSLKKFSRF